MQADADRKRLLGEAVLLYSVVLLQLDYDMQGLVGEAHRRSESIKGNFGTDNPASSGTFLLRRSIRSWWNRLDLKSSYFVGFPTH
jgi:hypothetical protein